MLIDTVHAHGNLANTRFPVMIGAFLLTRCELQGGTIFLYVNQSKRPLRLSRMEKRVSWRASNQLFTSISLFYRRRDVTICANWSNQNARDSREKWKITQHSKSAPILLQMTISVQFAISWIGLLCDVLRLRSTSTHRSQRQMVNMLSHWFFFYYLYYAIVSRTTKRHI